MLYHNIFKALKQEKLSVIVILLLASVSVAFLFLLGFLWSVKNGQYDDQISPALRILFDDLPISQKNEIVEPESIKNTIIKTPDAI